MSTPRKITQFFKRPDFSLVNRDASTEGQNASPRPLNRQSSPLTEPSSSFISNLDPAPQTPDGPGLQLKDSLLRSVRDETETKASDSPTQSSQQSGGATPDPSSSFNAAQRIVKNGKQVVISSDGEDTDSDGSIEAPDALFKRLVPPSAPKVEEKEKDDDSSPGMTLRGRRSKENFSRPKKTPQPRNYKFSIESLVTQAVDDNETEARIAKFRESSERSRATGSDLDTQRQLNEEALTSALGDQDDDESGLRRLLDAVRRTEAFDVEKAWFFFDYGSHSAPLLDFPKDLFHPEAYTSVLREPETRERAFLSGVVDFALSRGTGPDELIEWIFLSVSSESRDSLRNAYCRAFQSTPPDTIKQLIQPKHIDALFQRLGAKTRSLDVHHQVAPDAIPTSNLLQGSTHHRNSLLSVLGLLRGAAASFSNDTQEHIINLLFRLALDVSLTSNALICSDLERTIVAMLDSTADEILHQIGTTTYNTIKDPLFQSRLLSHIPATSRKIATLRSRLALTFLTNDPSPLSSPPETISYLKQTTELLKDPRFNVKRFKAKGQAEFDYGELAAITALLNVVIDSGWSGLAFPDQVAERDFNAEVDALADRVKKIFTSIEDSGASHLKRTLAKEGLEALHYRIVYSVRSKPRPKKSLLGEHVREDRKLNRWFTTTTGDAKIPIRGHEES